MNKDIKAIRESVLRFEGRTHKGPNGELRWNSNGAVVPPHVFEEKGVKPPAGQVEAHNADVARALRNYRLRAANRELTPEERFEMRAAFGEGETVVDIITGQKFKV